MFTAHRDCSHFFDTHTNDKLASFVTVCEGDFFFFFQEKELVVFPILRLPPATEKQCF